MVEIEGRQLKLSNLDKVLYPATGFTKGQVVDYYARIAPVLVPHLAGRPLTLKRYPNGVDSEYFFEKNATAHRPEWVKTAPIWSEGNRRNVNYILADDLSTVVWMANLAAVELHPSLSLARKIDCPLFLVAGKQDRLVPWQDAQRIASEVRGPVELLVIEDGNHIANNRPYRYRLRSADWMAARLGLPKI